jgi:hypothetical protein
VWRTLAGLRESSRGRLPSAGFCLPITPYLDGLNVDPETKRVLGLALETARIALGVTNSGDLANKIIAKQIIELAKVGERNPDLLCEGALKKLREHHLYGD